MRHSIWIIPLATLAVVSTAQAHPAQLAINQDDTPQMTVNFDDLNISAPQGAAVLLGRIKGAAVSVCGSSPDLRDVGAAQRYNHCLDSTMGQAVTRIGQPQLTAMYLGPAQGSQRFNRQVLAESKN
jgi:UrcA family protein